MKPSFSLVWSYLRNLGKKWILWLFLALDLIAVIAQIFLPFLTFPQGVYVGIAILGLLWAGFETYLDLLSKVPDESRPLQPEIDVVYEEGNEYSYRFETDDDTFSPEEIKSFETTGVNKQKRIAIENTLPHSVIILHVRVENIGLVTVNVLTIGADLDAVKPYHFMVPDVYDRNNKKVSFPIRLKPKDKLLLKVVGSIFPFSGFTDAQIAARTRNLRETKAIVDAEVFVEAIDPAGKIYRYRSGYKVSLLPLCNMYISHWEQLNNKNLVALALGETFLVSPDQQEDVSAKPGKAGQT